LKFVAMKFLLILSVFFCATASAQITTRMVIHFDFNKDDIRRRDAVDLDTLCVEDRWQFIKSIELYGHCDSVGNHTYNDALSNRRVQQAKAYMVERGVPGELFVKTEGFGKRQPLNENGSEKERFDNRRVELVITWTRPLPTLSETLGGAPKNPDIKQNNSLPELIKDTATAKAGTTIILRNIQFIPGRHFLLPESQPILDQLYQVMVDNPTLVIEIQGHVCCTPDNEDGYDMDRQTLDLSVQRAKAIYEHLVERNIAPARMSYKGFGGSRKLYQYERNAFEQQENRRVELRIVSR
jgi:outer membrane protein OmpA-like peptidoglycan-associated protein